MAAKFYITVQNDTFDAIAYRLWGDEHLAERLMAANPDYMDVLIFAPGTTLLVPDVASSPAYADLPPWYDGSAA